MLCVKPRRPRVHTVRSKSHYAATETTKGMPRRAKAFMERRRVHDPPRRTKPVSEIALHACRLSFIANNSRFLRQEIGGDYLFGPKGNQEGAEKKAEVLVSHRRLPRMPEAR